jgi:hypothetical protein
MQHSSDPLLQQASLKRELKYHKAMLRQEFLPFLTWQEIYNVLLLNKDGNKLVHQHYLEQATDFDGLARLLVREHKVNQDYLWPLTQEDLHGIICNESLP